MVYKPVHVKAKQQNVTVTTPISSAEFISLVSVMNKLISMIVMKKLDLFM